MAGRRRTMSDAYEDTKPRTLTDLHDEATGHIKELVQAVPALLSAAGSAANSLMATSVGTLRTAVAVTDDATAEGTFERAALWRHSGGRLLMLCHGNVFDGRSPAALTKVMKPVQALRQVALQAAERPLSEEARSNLRTSAQQLYSAVVRLTNAFQQLAHTAAESVSLSALVQKLQPWGILAQRFRQWVKSVAPRMTAGGDGQ